jgi:putative protease
MTKRIELLAPAGNFEKLEIAIHYGADAVYLAGKDFSLRNFSGNFTPDEMKRGIALAHENGVKVFVACNIFARNSEHQTIRDYIKEVADCGPDALIVADPGVFMAAREVAPDIDIHISTQANTTSWSAARFWKEQGATRINTARELSLEEISEIAEKGGVEVECFVHGAMCISHSGRCLISSFLNNRDANRGQCSHPCRWNYKVVEEKRPGQYLPVGEDERGTYIFHSKDLCMVDHIPALVQAGIASLKIEGRMKGVSYLATVVRAYREAIDLYYDDPEGFQPRPQWAEELSRVNNWNYSTGFFFGYEGDLEPNYNATRPATVHRFAGKVIAAEGDVTTIQVRNKLNSGDRIEILSSRGPVTVETLTRIPEDRDPEGEGEEEAFMPESIVRARLSRPYEVNDIIRIDAESSYD